VNRSPVHALLVLQTEGHNLSDGHIRNALRKLVHGFRGRPGAFKGRLWTRVPALIWTQIRPFLAATRSISLTPRSAVYGAPEAVAFRKSASIPCPAGVALLRTIWPRHVLFRIWSKRKWLNDELRSNATLRTLPVNGQRRSRQTLLMETATPSRLLCCIIFFRPARWRTPTRPSLCLPELCRMPKPPRKLAHCQSRQRVPSRSCDGSH